MKNKETEEEKAKRCGYYFTPRGEIKRKAIIENLNKTSDEETSKRFRWMGIKKR